MPRRVRIVLKERFTLNFTAEQMKESHPAAEKLHRIAVGLREHFVKVQMLGEGNGTGDFHAVPGFTAFRDRAPVPCKGASVSIMSLSRRQRCGNRRAVGHSFESKVARKTDHVRLR